MDIVSEALRQTKHLGAQVIVLAVHLVAKEGGQAIDRVGHLR